MKIAMKSVGEGYIKKIRVKTKSGKTETTRYVEGVPRAYLKTKAVGYGVLINDADRIQRQYWRLAVVGLHENILSLENSIKDFVKITRKYAGVTTLKQRGEITRLATMSPPGRKPTLGVIANHC